MYVDALMISHPTLRWLPFQLPPSLLFVNGKTEHEGVEGDPLETHVWGLVSDEALLCTLPPFLSLSVSLTHTIVYTIFLSQSQCIHVSSNVPGRAWL